MFASVKLLMDVFTSRCICVGRSIYCGREKNQGENRYVKPGGSGNRGAERLGGSPGRPGWREGLAVVSPGLAGAGRLGRARRGAGRWSWGGGVGADVWAARLIAAS